MTVENKANLFEQYRRDLVATGLDTGCEESVLCPLCWKETHYDDLSLEHIVPQSVGGTRTILTCRECNNKQGSKLDSHLAKYQKAKDASQGFGSTRGELFVDGHRVAINCEPGSVCTNFRIIEKASNPAEVGAIQSTPNSVDKLTVKLSYGFIEERRRIALVRCAYLAMFEDYRYTYAKHEVVQVLRRQICNLSLEHPYLTCMVGEFGSPILPEVPCCIAYLNVNGSKLFLVVIKLCSKTESWHFVFMPDRVQSSNEFCDTIKAFSDKKKMHLKFSPDTIFM